MWRDEVQATHVCAQILNALISKVADITEPIPPSNAACLTARQRQPFSNNLALAMEQASEQQRDTRQIWNQRFNVCK